MGYRILGSVGRTLIAAGVLLLLFAGFQLWGTNIEEGRRQEDLAGSLAQSVGTELAGADEASKADALAGTLEGRTGEEAPSIPVGQGLGVIEIPKIGVKKIIVEGVNKDDLRKGPGHYPGTPLPGQPGNAAIAGHRTTYGAPFNRIDELVPGDEIVVFTPQGKFTYQVIAPPDGAWKVIERGPGWFSVRPTQSQVLAATIDNRLTLTACHPKLSAEQRIIVVAELVDTPAATTTSTSAVPAVVTDGSAGSVDDSDAVTEAPHALPAEAFDAGLRRRRGPGPRRPVGSTGRVRLVPGLAVAYVPDPGRGRRSLAAPVLGMDGVPAGVRRPAVVQLLLHRPVPALVLSALDHRALRG